MAKKVVWSFQAQSDRKQILEFWIRKNKSKNYSNKLNELFKSSIKLIADYPNIGRKTDYLQIRSKVASDYQIFYEVKNDRIEILSIWDSRQDPEKLNEKIK